MNKRLVIRLLGAIILVEAASMVPSLLIALLYREPGDAPAMFYSILLCAVVGAPMFLLARPERTNLRAKDGFGVVALAWILMSILGAMPFVFSGLIPNFFDALFESVSGFTTTGATVLQDFDRPLHGVRFWRSFTHWIGGMGVLVLTLALLPKLTGRTAHLVRAESPGPSLSKIRPKMGDSAKMLYTIYGALTLLEFACLMLAGMDIYDAALHAVSTAGTGGFSSNGASIGGYNSLAIEIVITVFMLLFGMNFALFYRLWRRDAKALWESEELKWYLGIALGASLLLAVLIFPVYRTFGEALRYSTFNVATVMSTTGFGNADFNLWPIPAKMLIFVLMFLGGCVGSTAGGMKIMRVALLMKGAKREIARTFQPRKVQTIRFEGHGIDDSMLSSTAAFFGVYVVLILIGAFIVSLEGHYDVETNLTAALTCVSNVGPGLGVVGPAGSFAGYSSFSKVVFSLLMLAGRLELFPILVLFDPQLWKK